MSTERATTSLALAWICNSCAHFMVTIGERAARRERPGHDCPVAQRRVEFVDYVDSVQVGDIVHRRDEPCRG